MMFWKTAVWLEMVPAVLGVADILMVKPVSGADYTQTVDYQQAIALGFTVDAVDTSQWASLSQSTFAQYRALLVNPYGISGGGSYAPLQFLTDTKNVWSPAVIGNMVLVGTDPGNHGRTIPGAANLINHAVNFAASGSGTGLYMQLPSNGGDPDTGTQIDALSYFGSFMYRTVSGDNNCHIVAQSPALGTLSDADISNWSYSVHGVFASYPNSSPNGALYTFQPLAIDKDRTGAGLQTYPDGTSGVPYILARGVTPQGCGDGVKQTSYGEQW
ncbi:hypothetical protein F4778DRAFT_696373 [Xylariomycetidae sp. FL2044]|nr:hypothetical protein F4778DRAFT_696373 [Xylariomycetidae sp. FL2044]